MKRFKVRQIYLLFILILSGFLITGCGGSGGVTETGHWLPKDVVSIEVTPPNPSIATATTQQFMATGIYAENAHFDLTSSVTWSSSDTNIATISNAPGSKGLATAKAAGIITIKATDPATGIFGTATLTVKPTSVTTLTSIEVTPVNPSIALGTNQPFIATGIYSDATTQNLTSSVTWTSSNTGIATIDTATNSVTKGLATSKAIGATTITATDTATGKSGYTTLAVTAATLVSIEVTPVNPSIALGTNQPFIATGTYTDATTQPLTSSVAWTSSNTGIATINTVTGSIDKGLATSIAIGTTTITATDTATGKSGYTTLTVTAVELLSIEVTPVNPSIALGTKQQFIAMGTYSDATTQNLTSLVTWSSSDMTVATISNAADGSNGLATSLHVGESITITATVPHTVITGTAHLTVTAATLVSIAVTPVNPSIALGTKQQFIATGTYTNATTQVLTSSVTWTSETTTVAAIDTAPGSVTKGEATSLAIGTTKITATDPTTLKFGDSILTVTNATLVSIAVTPADASISVGATQQFIATGTYTDATTQDLTTSVTWTTPSMPTAVASISNVPGFNGLATALTVGGPIRIHVIDPATLKFGNAKLTVTAAAVPTQSPIPLGTAATFGIMATSAITNTGFSIINGDVSLDPGTSMTGFPPGVVNGTIHINDTVSAKARIDLLFAYNLLKNLAPGTGTHVISGGADLGGLDPGGLGMGHFPPGTYTSGTTMLVSTPLVLDAGGNADAVWVFQIGSSLTTGASVTLANGAQTKNVFWVPTSDATIGVGTIFEGTIVAGRDASAVTGATINGRILAGAITAGTIALQTNVVTVPAP